MNPIDSTDSVDGLLSQSRVKNPSKLASKQKNRIEPCVPHASHMRAARMRPFWDIETLELCVLKGRLDDKKRFLGQAGKAHSLS